VVAAALAAAFAVVLPASITSAWIRGTILSTSGYVATVTPVAASPAVRAAVQDAVASRVGAAVSYAEASLPPSARGLAGLLGSRLAGFARNGVGQLMAGQAFQQLWADANRLAHSQIIGILNGDSAYVTAAGGEVVLNLLPLVNDVLHTVSRHLSAMTGGAVSLSPVTTLPAAACHALNRTASSACTQIPLFPVAALAGPRHGYRLLVASLSLVLVLTTLALAGSEALRALAPAVPLLQPVRDPLERLARQGRRFPAHPALVHPDHPVQVDPGRPVLTVPPARADRHEVALAVVILAGQLHSQVGPGRFDGHHEHRPVLAPPVVLLERHPGPDDLAGIRRPVRLRRVAHPHRPDAMRIDLHGGVRPELARQGLPMGRRR